MNSERGYKMKNISFSPPDITEAEIKEVAEALRSGWITTGPRTKKLEQKIANFSGTEKAVCLNSATAALELNLRVLGIYLYSIGKCYKACRCKNSFSRYC